jgi:4-hydroxy-2-oxoheptanedioate aldolase
MPGIVLDQTGQHSAGGRARPREAEAKAKEKTEGKATGGEPAVAIRDILRNNVKDKLARGEVVASMTVRLVRTIEIARIARTAGFDTLYVDVEHSSFSLETTSQICMAALEAGIAPFVRVPANTPDYIARVLDGGALGVIAPHISSAQAAREVVRAAKFPLLGERSNAGLFPHLHFRSFPAPEMQAALNDATMVIVQFESAAALDNTEEIVAVEGVDMVLIGLNDLLADWGIPGEYDHPRVRETYARTIAACRKHGKHCGVGGLATRPDLAAEFVRMGARYVSTGTDLAFLLSACSARAKQVQEIKL